MEKHIKERVINEADYIIKNKKTIRELAKVFNLSKSTIHKDLTEKLPLIDNDKFKRVDEILKYHLSVRHIRGGNSTKRKYQKGN